MRSRRGGYVGISCSHHPARLRGHPSSGRRGIHFVRRSKSVIPHPLSTIYFFFPARSHIARAPSINAVEMAK